MRPFVIAIALLLLSLTPAAPGRAAAMAGVTFPDTVTVEGKTLHLNGIGVRKKFFFKIYLGALYLETTTRDARQVIESDQVKRVVMHFLYDEVDKEKLRDAWREGFEANSADRMEALGDRLARFNQWWPTMREGDRAVLTYIPGTGTIVTIKGEDKGVIEGADFGRALWAVWFGAVPADEGLMEGMLGGH